MSKAKSKVSAVVQIRQDVKQQILDQSKGGGAVRDRVVNDLVRTEIDRRADLLAQVMTKHEQKTKELEKINNPDNQTFGRTKAGVMDTKNPVAETFSKERALQIAKLEEEIAKIDEAIEAAFDAKAPNFDLLSKINQKG